MIVKRIKLQNWKNFQHCDVKLADRCFIVGANASGKSNFIDALRFLRDISKQSGSLQSAVEERGGMTKIRCLAARRNSNISIEVEWGEPDVEESTWRYSLDFAHTGGGFLRNQVIIRKEEVYHFPTGKCLLKRSEETEQGDEETLKYTHLEQPNSSKDFRDLRNFFQSIEYLNVVPQLVRESASTSHSDSKEDYYGRNFLRKLSRMNEQTKKSYFKKVNEFLILAVPQLKELSLVKDEMGIPHLEVRYVHWRSSGAKQQEQQLSDGTLRLIGFLFALIDNRGVILLEEPELNLHSGIIGKIPEFLAKVLRQKKKNSRQIILTTHSYDILSNGGISPDEVLLLRNTAEGTKVNRVSEIEECRAVLEAGLSMADATIPITRPENIESMSMFDFS